MEEELTIQTAQRELERLQNNLEYWLGQKELIFKKTQPSSKPLNGVMVNGGKRVDKNLQYVIKDEEIDNKIDLIAEQMSLYEKFIENEMKRLEKYGMVKQQVVLLKETPYYDERQKRYRSLTWEEIAKKVHYSVTTCRNIYRNVRRKRNI